MPVNHLYVFIGEKMPTQVAYFQIGLSGFFSIGDILDIILHSLVMSSTTVMT